mmetsp:Transcript_568/g.1812  ORF Transcript_568/g.1812 Transcript_568/m.1812 type:complete len:289 (-) Transcript_568:288-1154(-)
MRDCFSSRAFSMPRSSSSMAFCSASAALALASASCSALGSSLPSPAAAAVGDMGVTAATVAAAFSWPNSVACMNRVPVPFRFSSSASSASAFNSLTSSPRVLTAAPPEPLPLPPPSSSPREPRSAFFPWPRRALAMASRRRVARAVRRVSLASKGSSTPRSSSFDSYRASRNRARAARSKRDGATSCPWGTCAVTRGDVAETSRAWVVKARMRKRGSVTSPEGLKEGVSGWTKGRRRSDCSMAMMRRFSSAFGPNISSCFSSSVRGNFSTRNARMPRVVASFGYSNWL